MPAEAPLRKGAYPASAQGLDVLSCLCVSMLPLYLYATVDLGMDFSAPHTMIALPVGFGLTFVLLYLAYRKQLCKAFQRYAEEMRSSTVAKVSNVKCPPEEQRLQVLWKEAHAYAMLVNNLVYGAAAVVLYNKVLYGTWIPSE